MVYRIIFLFLCVCKLSFAQKLSREDYIKKYSDLAISQMNISGIPASIILSQAILESNNGNSELALKSNNHFGIKCHNTWNGKRVYHDDDLKQECFRKYASVKKSYEDHSQFLKKKRYAFLFDIPISNYKGWAKGLKKAGYATNSKYPSLLISIIEKNDLTRFDKQQLSDSVYFVSGTSYGYPYILSQQFLYSNESKEYYLSTKFLASLTDLNIQLGGGKLLTNKIGLGLNFGYSFSKQENSYNYEPFFGLESKFLISIKNSKKLVIDVFVNTNTDFEMIPAISIGLLR